MSQERAIDVSVILNGHREGHLIHPTLGSVRRALDYARGCNLVAELIVVLDRPDADTMDVVSRACAGDGQVHPVDFGDPAMSRNYGIGQARGRFASFIDGDDLWCREWLVDATLMARHLPGEAILHPEYSVYFGDDFPHVLHHVDMESDEFEPEHFLKQNYWTALSFAARETYRRVPYVRSSLQAGFGYEDWTWNHETMRQGILHKVVPATSHFIRRGKHTHSVNLTANSTKTVSRMLDVYRLPPLAA